MKLARLSGQAAVLTVTVSAALALLFAISGYPVHGHDALLHESWLKQLVALQTQGLAYPRWLPDSFLGLGAPDFYFYPPLAYFLAGAVHSLSALDPRALLAFTELLASAAGSIILYAILTGRGYERRAAVVAALAYSVAGYRFVDIYTRGAFGEHVALMFLPLVLANFRSRVREVAALGITLALVILSNVPVAIMAAVLLAARWYTQRSIAEGAAIISAGILACAASSFYWYPAWYLSGLIQTEHLADALPIQSEFGQTISEIALGRFDRLTLTCAFTLVAGCVLLYHDIRARRSDLLTWAVAIAVMLQIPFVSTPVWRHVPLLEIMQFGWRWDAVILLAVAVRYAQQVDHAKVALLLATIGTLVAAFPLIAPSISQTSISDEPDHHNAPEHATIWSPRTVKAFWEFQNVHSHDPELLPLDPSTTLTLDDQRRQPEYRKYELRLERSTRVRLRMLYWPYWSAVFNGKPAILLQDSGLAAVTLPAGHSTLELRLVPIEHYRAVNWVSVVGTALLIVLLAIGSYRELRSRDT